jgi:hypothetical protein
MYARTITATLVPGKADEAIEIFRTKIVPIIREQPGYVSAAIYLDREHNRAQTVSLWQTREAESATAVGSAYLPRVVSMLSGCLVNRDVDSWEVALVDEA